MNYIILMIIKMFNHLFYNKENTVQWLNHCTFYGKIHFNQSSLLIPTYRDIQCTSRVHQSYSSDNSASTKNKRNPPGCAKCKWNSIYVELTTILLEVGNRGKLFLGQKKETYFKNFQNQYFALFSCTCFM